MRVDLGKIIPEKGVDYQDGITFTPKISNGVLSWTNNGDYPNPDPIRITGEGTYELAVNGGYTGSYTDFIQSLVNISDFPTRLENLENGLDEAQGDIVSIIEKRRQLSGMIIENQNNITELAAKVNNLNDKVEEHDESIFNVSEDTYGLVENKRFIMGKINELEEKLKEYVPYIPFSTAFPDAPVTGTTAEFYEYIKNLNLPLGSCYLGEASFTDMTRIEGVKEVKVEIRDNNTPYLSIQSQTASPYPWVYTGKKWVSPIKELQDRMNDLEQAIEIIMSQLDTI